MSRFAAKQRGQVTEMRDTTTQETAPLGAMYQFVDDFDGYQFLNQETGSDGKWLTVEVALNTAIAQVDAHACGVISLGLDADSNAEDAVLYWNNIRGVPVDAGCVFECRARASVLPTTGVACVFGMAGDHNLDKDTVAENAWFRLQASGALLCETDDTTNDNDDVSAGMTLVATDWHVYKIDFTNIADVRFYVDNAQVGSATTFDMSNLTSAEALMQPYFSLDKASGTGVGTLLVDYVRIWSFRE